MIDARAAQGPGDFEKGRLRHRTLRAQSRSAEQLLPVWVGNFVLTGYGTGAIMAVPAHDQRDFEFCRKYGLPVVPAIRPVDGELPHVESSMQQALEIEGVVENSGGYSGLAQRGSTQTRMASKAESEGFGKPAVTFRLKDWGVSRQRYWGTPIPVIHCPIDGVVPVLESDLPVLLPDNVRLTGDGQSPLASVPEFVNVTCPKCGGPARRETDTMDTFVDSSWYFYRYCDPHNSTQPFDPAKIAYWFPIDQYIGGIEHAILHLIYSRFWTKMMREIGLVTDAEPIRKLFSQGMVISEGAKMSKSRGNVKGADAVAEKYGADAGRMFVLFAGPPEREVDWTDAGIEGIVRFLGRVYRFVTRNAGTAGGDGSADRDALRKLHQTLRKITEDFDTRWHFNTSIAAVMELLNELYAVEAKISGPAMREILRTVSLLLAPFAPYLSQELWAEQGFDGLVFKQQWPQFNPELALDEGVQIVLQVNGKVRGRMTVPHGTTCEELEVRARQEPNVGALLTGKTVVKVICVPDRLVNFVIR